MSKDFQTMYARYRNAAGMTQEYAAELLGVAVGMWERGETIPTADKLPDIAAALGCSIDDLYRDYTETKEETP